MVFQDEKRNCQTGISLLPILAHCHYSAATLSAENLKLFTHIFYG